MDTKFIIGIATVLMGIYAYVAYIRGILRGETKPHIFSWLIWTSITYAIFFIQSAAGAGPGAWVTLTVALITSIICVLSLRYGEKDIRKVDYLFFAAAMLAYGLWLGIDEPTLSMILLVSTGILGFVPTIRKSWQQPHTETLATYLVNTLRHGLSAAALTQYTLLTALFPVAWTFANGLFVLMLLLRRRQIHQSGPETTQ